MQRQNLLNLLAAASKKDYSNAITTGVWTKFGRRPSPRFVQKKSCTEGDGCGQILSKLQITRTIFMQKVSLALGPGKPQPYGVTKESEGLNFALFSRHATAVSLYLFRANHEPLAEIDLDPQINKTGDIWHIYIQDLTETLYYSYRINGSSGPEFCYDKNISLLDPYAKEVSTPLIWNTYPEFSWVSQKPYMPLGIAMPESAFDWQGIRPPNISVRDLIIYEMHVRGFTVHPSGHVQHRGTFLGMIEKIPHLLELGVNAVELLPIQEFDENEVKRYLNPALKKLCNYWGYSTVNFFSPMNRYAVKSAIPEFKTLVRELHRNGIEVILDVVFNHTAESSQEGGSLSFQGIDYPIYYMLDSEYQRKNYSGCGNTFNCNNPIVRRLIIDCLRYWVVEMHVDGFRFDLASILTRSQTGQPLDFAPILEEISEDPILANVKLIAEPWDAAGLYQIGSFAAQSNRWSEWNGKYRDAVRRFIKATPEQYVKSEFVTRICGSQDIYNNRSPQSSLNFVISHDGFTLHDLVSYNEKHNEANGENNQDGMSNNESWNCGAEGPTNDPEILELRGRQMRNLHFALMISQGIPMLCMGDEYAHTKKGNNNTWCQDNELNWFLWDQLKENEGFYRFYRKMIHFRKNHNILRRESFLSSQNVEWHGTEPLKPDWHNERRLVAFTLLDNENQEDLYIVFNAELQEIPIEIPSARTGMAWHWIVNTSNTPPQDYFDDEEAPVVPSLELQIKPFTAWMLKAKKK
jgi:isoamylase